MNIISILNVDDENEVKHFLMGYRNFLDPKNLAKDLKIIKSGKHNELQTR